MAVGRKTGGRKKGSLNKAKLGIKAQKVVEAQLEAALAKGEKSPLEVMLEFMRDIDNPPGFRGEMAKAAAPYVHSKAPEAQPEGHIQITRIERIIVPAKYAREDPETED
jgi:hypothetical protein